jgi:hypothetical protein
MGHIHQANAYNGKGNGIEDNEVDQAGDRITPPARLMLFFPGHR